MIKKGEKYRNKNDSGKYAVVVEIRDGGVFFNNSFEGGAASSYLHYFSEESFLKRHVIQEFPEVGVWYSSKHIVNRRVKITRINGGFVYFAVYDRDDDTEFHHKLSEGTFFENYEKTPIPETPIPLTLKVGSRYWTRGGKGVLVIEESGGCFYALLDPDEDNTSVSDRTVLFCHDGASAWGNDDLVGEE